MSHVLVRQDTDRGTKANSSRSPSRLASTADFVGTLAASSPDLVVTIAGVPRRRVPRATVFFLELLHSDLVLSSAAVSSSTPTVRLKCSLVRRVQIWAIFPNLDRRQRTHQPPASTHSRPRAGSPPWIDAVVLQIRSCLHRICTPCNHS